jgi:hypothetical protein
VDIQLSPARLHLVLQRVAEEPFEPESVADVPLVRFAAYTAHQRVFGWVRLRADRLTDLLNDHDELHLADVELQGLPNGLIGTVDEVLIRRHDLVAVQASGPRGDEARRLATRTHPIAMQSGNYLICGYLHAPPGTDPIESVRTRPAMVPLTFATIEYWLHGKREHQSVGTIVVNRDALDWVRVVSHEDLIEGQLRPE